jgi:hypothetical protein
MIDSSLFSGAEAEPITAVVGVACRGIPYSYAGRILPAAICATRKQERVIAVGCGSVHVIKRVSVIIQSCSTGCYILLVERIICVRPSGKRDEHRGRFGESCIKSVLCAVF